MISYGSYPYVHIDSKNNMNLRSVPAIALRPSYNNGGYYFFNLETNKRIHSYIWNQLPIPQKIIDRVQKIAISETQPKFKNGNLIFEWSKGVIEEEDTETYENNDDIKYEFRLNNQILIEENNINDDSDDDSDYTDSECDEDTSLDKYIDTDSVTSNKDEDDSINTQQIKVEVEE